MTAANVTTLGEARTTRDLAARLVSEGLVTKPANMSAFEAALQAANPHLADVAILPPGTPVVIPGGLFVAVPTEPGRRSLSKEIADALAAASAARARGAAARRAALFQMQNDAALEAIGEIKKTDEKLAARLATMSSKAKAELAALDVSSAGGPPGAQTQGTHS